ncbi:MAG: DUF262 domain-containing protein [Lachnospiraceae bacterium]|nr:DUF262 domain-containing protein [Lachnospiraceae bacterium]
MGTVFDKKLNDIITFARKKGNCISYYTVIDILKSEDKEFDQEMIAAIMEAIAENGISIKPEMEEDYPANEADSDIFIPAEVNISQKPVTIYNLMERLENDEINLNPGFQRHSNLWSREQQSRLIESLMLKIPIPAFYFDASSEDNWVVIDGLQRLTAFRNYLTGIENGDGIKEKFRFKGLQYLADFENLTFDDLPRQYMRRIKETSVIAYTVEKGTPDEVVFNIFQRINTGGVVLNDQEIRQALHQGKATEMIQRLAENEAFLRATGNAVPVERMVDREYVTRYLAFTELNCVTEYKGNIDNFLIKAMKYVEMLDDKQMEEIEQHFVCVMDSCYEIFGKYAFRKYSESGRRGPINKALFELWSVCLHELTEGQLKILIEKKDCIINDFRILLLNREFLSALRAGDQLSAIRRIDMVRKMIKEYLC